MSDIMMLEGLFGASGGGSGGGDRPGGGGSMVIGGGRRFSPTQTRDERLVVEGIEDLSSVLSPSDKAWVADLDRRSIAFGQGSTDSGLMETFADVDAKVESTFNGSRRRAVRRHGFADTDRLIQSFADYVPESDTGTAWPSINGQPAKITDERVLRFLEQHLRQVVKSGRYTRGHLAKMAEKFWRNSQRHSEQSLKLSHMVNKVREQIAGRKIAYEKSSGVADKFDHGKQLLREESKLRALTAEFALHGATAQSYAMAAGVLREACNAPEDAVRARAMAFAEVMVKMPHALDIKTNGGNGAGVPTVNQLAQNDKLREKAMFGQIDVWPGVGTWAQTGGGLGGFGATSVKHKVKDKAEEGVNRSKVFALKALRADLKVKLRVHRKLLDLARTSFVRRMRRREVESLERRLAKVREELAKLGSTDLDGFGNSTMYPDTIWDGVQSAMGLGEMAPVDAWGRVRPGATPREEDTLLFIDKNLGSFGSFDGGWWTRWKKRASKNWQRWVKNAGKDVKKAAQKSVKDAGNEIQKQAAEKMSDAAGKLMDKAGSVIEKGLNAGLSKLGDSPAGAAPGAMAPVDSGAETMDTGSGMPGWVLPVGLAGAAAVAIGGYVWWSKRR